MSSRLIDRFSKKLVLLFLIATLFFVSASFIFASTEGVLDEPEKSETQTRDGLKFAPHVTTLYIALASGWLSREEARQFNRLNRKRKFINQRASLASSADEYQSLRRKYKNNQKKMDEHDRNVQTLDAVTLFALMWEAYLVYTSESFQNFRISSSSSTQFNEGDEWGNSQNYRNSTALAQITLAWKW